MRMLIEFLHELHKAAHKKDVESWMYLEHEKFDIRAVSGSPLKCVLQVAAAGKLGLLVLFPVHLCLFRQASVTRAGRFYLKHN